MQFKLVGKNISGLTGGCLAVGVYEGQVLTPLGKEVDQAMTGLLSDFLKDIGFEAKCGNSVFMPGHKDIKFKNIVVVGLGKKEELRPDVVRQASAAALKKAKEIKNADLFLEMLGKEVLGDKVAKYLVEGILLGNYHFDKYKRKKETEIEVSEIKILEDDSVQDTVLEGQLLAEGANFVRDLVNEPGNVIRPEDLAQRARDLAREYGLECTVFNEEELKKRGMNGILAVGQGSAHPPRFIHLVYRPQPALKKIVFVGKGITFDSGGLDIKPEQFMKTMKCDKAGACAVLGLMKLVAQLKLPLEVHGLIPTAENMPGGNAFHPDDIIVYNNGKSVEIDNTDAEGRLILADALIYGSNLKPDYMIDMATLTGACMVALGRLTTGVFTENQALATEIKETGEETGEKFWPLPLDEDLKEDIKGKFGDIKNVGSRYGGAITAGLFLKEFVGDKVKNWVHLDIAGPAFLEKPWKYYAEGATGVPVRTLLEWLKGIK